MATQTSLNSSIPMGRKSQAKKVVREYIKDKEDTSLGEKLKKDKKAKKELKKEILKKSLKVKKEPKKAKPKSKLNLRDKGLFKGGFVLIMITMMFAVGFLLFQKAFRAEDIARYLPLENTVLTVEINSNLNHNQLTKALNLLKNHPDLSQKSFTQKIEEKFGISFEKQMKSWMGREVGFALLDFGTQEKADPQTIYFVEILSEKNLKDMFLSEAESVEYKNHKLYSFADGKNATVIGDYLFISNNKPVIKNLVENAVSTNKKLSKDKGYIKIQDNLPVNKTGFLYINYDKITLDLIKKSEILAKIETIKPITDLFKSEGLALIAMDDKFAIQSFLNLNNDGVKNTKYISFKEKYEAKLLDYISKDALTYWGGKNLDYQINRMIEVFAGGEKSSVAVFDNVLQNYTQRYFGDETSLRKDILPIFNNEYALALENIEGENVYKLIIEIKDMDKDVKNVHKIAESFASAGGVYQEKTVAYTLPDGTNSREVMAVPEAITSEEIDMDGTKVYALKIGSKKQGIFYAFIGDRAVITDSIDGIKSTIELSENKLPSLLKSPNFTKLISPLLSNSDEVTYFNTDKLLPILFKNTSIPTFLSPAKAMASGKNYFADGITTINYLNIE